MRTVPAPPPGVSLVREEPVEGPVPLHTHPGWRHAYPWLVQGTTGRGGTDPFDLGLFGAAPVGAVLGRWRTLRESTAMNGVAHSFQVHGAAVQDHAAAPTGLLLSDGYDGHVTSAPGLLLTISVADCVPISVVDPARRRVAVLHGGWRGTARGVLAAGLARLGGDPSTLRVHLGPAICGRCYEVGPEVHEALGLTVPGAPTPVDVRAVLARQAVEAGVPPAQVSSSEHCTRCGRDFFSHRGGDPERQMGVLGIRP